MVLIFDNVRELTWNAGTLPCGTDMLLLACLVAGMADETELKHYRTANLTMLVILPGVVMGIPPWPLLLRVDVLETTRPYRNAGLLKLADVS